VLNPHFAVGTKDQDAARIFYEPLAAFDPEGELVPVLAAEVPSLRRGTLAPDLTWATWRLKRDVLWHDGTPFTARDVVFTWELVRDPATGAATAGAYRPVARVEALDAHTVRVTFTGPQPFWAEAFCGSRGLLLPRHVFAPFAGARAREAPANRRPVGTGPFRLVEFRPGDLVRAEANDRYHEPGRPFFDTLEVKGGGDAVSAARAVLQTGEYDYAWGLLVEDEVLRRIEQGGKGYLNIVPTGSVEHIQCNLADPWTAADAERAGASTAHPVLADPAFREALGLLVDRAAVQAEIYGRLGQTTANFLNAPARYRSAHTRWEYNPARAQELLEGSGWRRGPDGVRTRDGRRLRLVFQTSVNAPRQKTQQIVKQAAARAGIEVELKSVAPTVFFGSDPTNPDAFTRFAADLQMYTATMTAPDPQWFMSQFTSWEIPTRANGWQGRNVTQFRSAEYDRVYRAAEGELDPVRRAALFIRMNDIVVQSGVVIPILWRNAVSASGTGLRGAHPNPWDSTFWRLADWHRE
jgi:peptide/nickel transport system substrate-binding protein